MSLIITSSSQGLDETNQIGIAKPEQYKNHMKNSLIIEPDSEIAVESVKINRLPMLDAGAGIVGNFWFGRRLSQVVPLELSLSYIIPTENEIGRSLTPVDFADQYINTLREAYSLHPEIDSAAIEMNTQYDASGAFTGYEYRIPQIGSAGVNAIPADTSEVGDPLNTNPATGTGIMAYTGGVFTSQYDDQMGQLLPRHTESGPIALNAGLLQFAKPPVSTFTYGLSRPYCFDAPTFWDNTSENNVGYSGPGKVFKGAAGDGLGPKLDQFYDYAIEVREDDKLRIYHSAPTHIENYDPAASPNYPYEQRMSRNGESIVMTEIVYWNNTDTAFNASNGSNSAHVGAGPLTWSSASGDIAFKTDGEKLTISVSGTQISGASGGNGPNASFKGQIPKPISQTCWKMYPTVGLWTKGDKATIQKYTGRTNTTMWNNQPENSWITKSIQAVALPEDGVSSVSEDYNPFGEFTSRETTPAWNNAQSWGHTIDCRDMFRPYNNEVGNESGTNIHTYRGITSKVIEDYENIFITGRAERYMDRAIQQFQPNSGFILGFYPMGFTPLAGSMTLNVGASFVSAQRPSLMSQHSAFIRVPTFTHQTYNFGTGNPSKILFQVPRFDNAGTETGALYYQNNDKTYVDLNNATQLNITELDVQIVRKNETFVEDLTGSTEVVFHVRKKK
tara:strand:+ start:1641 stop:3662 length:2022 start_codon:yes stop_codon:yes gene_type:complete